MPAVVTPTKAKPDVPKRPHTKLAAHFNRGCRCEALTRTEVHALASCPDCAYPLRGSSIDYRRQVIDLPLPQSGEVIEHQVIKRWCPACQRWRRPTLDLTGQVVGQGRIGRRLASLIASLALVLRVPVRRIHVSLRTLHQLTISIGEIVELLHQVRRTRQDEEDARNQQARDRPIRHGDETGWRENGRPGSI
ncbi:IS66 family transposase zinc-finger binding domain-containing protein [Chloroflexus sp.]|uniref:IS66 family transposase zinc-finger binding domain-containing protein n=1 Tax=Chloroflexus sp. TaxID=1904827 RepID=UPI003A0FF17C